MPISARRLRTDSCQISTIGGNIDIGSYVESQNLKISTESGNINIGKKLGITGYGHI